MPAPTSQKAGTTSSVAPPMGRKMSTAEKIPRNPIQRATRPTRMALSITAIMPAASARPPSRARYWLARLPAPFVSAFSTAWREWSWPTAKLCVLIAPTIW